MGFLPTKSSGRADCGGSLRNSAIASSSITDLSFEAILKNTANLPPHTAIFWHLMNVDAAGVAHEQNAALKAIPSTAALQSPQASPRGQRCYEADEGPPQSSALSFVPS